MHFVNIPKSIKTTCYAVVHSYKEEDDDEDDEEVAVEGCCELGLFFRDPSNGIRQCLPGMASL